LVGITLAVLYALTGNLFASILWHMLFDVRFSFGTLTIEGTTQQPAHAADVSPNLVDGSEPEKLPEVLTPNESESTMSNE
jgi:hypothetical protein